MHASAKSFLCAVPLSMLLACIDDPADLDAMIAETGPAPHEAGPAASDTGASAPEASLVSDAGHDGTDSGALEPGSPVVNAPVPAQEQQAFDALRARAEAAAKFDAAGALAAYPTKFHAALDYEPNAAEYIERIQASALALSDGERAALGTNGFVISTRREFPTFLRGLAEIYFEHLPLYVSADLLLEAVHSSYDTLLIEFEYSLLLPELRALLTGMRSRLPSATADAATLADTDVYLSVALALLDGTIPPPVAGAPVEDVTSIVERAEAAMGTGTLTLFEVERREDFSQFKPRGHYRALALQRYFRAMIWLGRVDFRMLETLPNGSQVFRRRQFLATLLIDELVAPDRPRFERIDTVIRTFVGESDYMVLPEVAALVADLGGLAAARAATDQAVIAALLAGGYGKQQIAGHLMVSGGGVQTLPLNRSFALLGQRYVVDSHVFSELVYDRLPNHRMMPTPLDVAFAALGNAQALSLNPDLRTFSALPGGLARMRVLVDGHDQTFWDANFYNLWLRSLRALSPAQDLGDPAALGLPQLAGSEAWGRRLLNAQLGSWAELRHDTLLYAKQSYTGIPECGFPDVYVDPYPEFYRSLGKYAAAGSKLAALAADVAPAWSEGIASYFATLSGATSLLGEMAERELRGEPFSDEQLAFINDAVRIESHAGACTTVEVPDGWYAKLFYAPRKSIEFNPTIADVHTQPADESGNIVGRVLHVGTGYPRMLVATIDTCQGPRAYAGVVFSYHEQITQDFQRLDDQAWASALTAGPRPSDVPWLAGILAK
jgi:hypothetical protein